MKNKYGVCESSEMNKHIVNANAKNSSYGIFHTLKKTATMNC